MFDRKRQEGKSMIALQSRISCGTFLQNHVDAATYSGESGYFKIFETTTSKNNIDSFNVF